MRFRRWSEVRLRQRKDAKWRNVKTTVQASIMGSVTPQNGMYMSKFLAVLEINGCNILWESSIQIPPPDLYLHNWQRVGCMEQFHMN